MILMLILIILLLSAIAYKITFMRSKKDDNIYNLLPMEDYQIRKEYFKKIIDEFNLINYEDVYIKSYDGLKLHARYYHCGEDKPIAICFHGYRGTAVRDFCGMAKFCINQKFNILVVDQRAHGLSKGVTITFGIKERKDVLSWVEYACSRFPNNKIVLYGISMGASSILMASNLSLPNNVLGLVADSPFNSPKVIIKKVISDMKLPVNLIYPFVYLGGLIFGGINLNSISVEDCLINAKIPFLLIHGKKDTFVPWEMSKIISKSRWCYKLLTVESAEHGISYIIDKDKYENSVKEFLKSISIK